MSSRNTILLNLRQLSRQSLHPGHSGTQIFHTASSKLAKLPCYLAESRNVSKLAKSHLVFWPEELTKVSIFKNRKQRLNMTCDVLCSCGVGLLSSGVCLSIVYCSRYHNSPFTVCTEIFSLWLKFLWSVCSLDSFTQHKYVLYRLFKVHLKWQILLDRNILL